MFVGNIGRLKFAEGDWACGGEARATLMAHGSFDAVPRRRAMNPFHSLEE